ncbi:histidine kinase/DNA gyrase B/HSP90-like ATPase [Ochrobactrum sp. BH3]|nr:histidine kinase/DNA gyrase B/HSP90-like ATPase [Ochrobactrum sp. BH3]
MSDPRELARERKRRQRAREKQVEQLEFVRTDASLFLHPDRLSQKAGAPKHLLRRMAIKELVDNALDAATKAILTMVDVDTFVVEDNGAGIDPAKVPTMFSVTRPMMSTKLIRRPTRGMVGNGNRVVAGSAFASGGGLIVESHGVHQELSFDRQSGETVVVNRADSEVIEGTRITIRFGAALPRDHYATVWGDTAIRLAGYSAKPMLTHPDWYSQASFDELIGAARGSAQDLADLFGVDLCHAVDNQIKQDEFADGNRDIGHADTVEIEQDEFHSGQRDIRSLTLETLKSLAPKAPALVPIPETAASGAYKIENIQANVAGANVPAIVQVWAASQADSTRITLIINRTPAVADMSVQVGGDAFINGCGLQWEYIGTVPKGNYGIVIAVTTPAVALISDGKTPDLSPFKEALKSAVGQALRRAHKPKSRGTSIKDAAYEVMQAAYLKASASGTLPANARQIMYAARPHILEMTGRDRLDDAYFTQTLLPAFMDENPQLTAEWDVVYDARGHLVEPHTEHSLPLGTLRVREYMRLRPRHDIGSLVSSNVSGLHPTAGPGDRYGTVLFIEKEGFEPLLRASRIAERYDIAVMSTKGMSVIAARALVDHLSASGIKILVAHDLDMAGIRIFGTLGADSNRYQFKHQPDIRRLGLTYDQALEMGLQSERQDIKGDHGRLIEGLKAYGATGAELKFITSGLRVELNAMPSDQFIEWIEHGLQAHGVEKIIPSQDTIEQRARQIIAVQHIHDDIRKLERQASDYAASVTLPSNLNDLIREAFQADPTAPWEEALLTAIKRNGEAA